MSKKTSKNSGGGCLLLCLKSMGILCLISLLFVFGWIAGLIWLIFFRKKLNDEPEKQKKQTIIVSVLSALSFVFLVFSLLAEPSSSSESPPIDAAIVEESSSAMLQENFVSEPENSTLKTSNPEPTETPATTVTPEPTPENTPDPTPKPTPTVAPTDVPISTEPPAVQEPIPDTTIADTGSYAVNGNNGKIHKMGACPATRDGENAMEHPVYFSTYEDAENHSIIIAPNQDKRKCGNCW